MTLSVDIAPLSDHHDRASFSCGIEALDRYLRTQATQDARRRLSNCFAASPVNSNSVAGYYTFSATSISLSELPDHLTKRLPRYPLVPAALIGRLAVDRQYHGRGLGAVLLADAIRRAVRSEPAVFALVVDAKDEAAAAFYRHHGFHPFASRPSSLFLPIATARKSIE